MAPGAPDKKSKVRQSDRNQKKAHKKEMSKEALLATYKDELIKAKAKVHNLEMEEKQLQATLREQRQEYEQSLRQYEELEYTRSSVGSDDDTPNTEYIVNAIKSVNDDLLSDIKTYINDVLRVHQQQQQKENKKIRKSRQSLDSSSYFLQDPRSSFLEPIRTKKVVSDVKKSINSEKFYLPPILEKPLNSHSDWVPVYGM